MLPLAIYLTEEYRLLDQRTLNRAFERYFIKRDSTLAEQLIELTDDPNPKPQAHPAETPQIEPVREPISRAEADHNFNGYFKQLETLSPGERILIAPETLHPRYSATQFPLICKDLIKRLVLLAHKAAERQSDLILDFSDEARLKIQLELLKQLIEATGRSVRLGVTLTASSKRCLPALGLIERIARDSGVSVIVRLLPNKDLEQEMIEAQRYALEAYPVLRDPELIRRTYRLAHRFLQSDNCTRIVPVLVDPGFALNSDEFEGCEVESLPNPFLIDATLAQVPDPIDLFNHTRKRAPGALAGDPDIDERVAAEIDALNAATLVAKPIIAGSAQADPERVESCHSPMDMRKVIGKRFIPNEAMVRSALSTVASAQERWDATELSTRKEALIKMTDQIAEHAIALAVCLSMETGKPLKYALEELREAVDLAYYYTGVCDTQLQPITLHCDQFASHVMELHGRGVFLLAPSPEQPVAETLGSLVAALITGNSVVIKPPEAASLTCAKLVELILKTPLPYELIAFLPGGLREIGDWLLEDYRIDGVVYTGLGVRGAAISQKLASRPGAQLIPLIVNAEGQSVVMVDADQSTHSLVRPILEQAVSTAGQYPLTSHVVYLEQSIADSFEQALVDALPLVVMSDPLLMSTDLGPVATRFRLDDLHGQVEQFRANRRVIAEQPLDDEQLHGLFMPPTILKLYTLDELQQVIPGPLLYLIRFDRNEISRVVNEINRTGYGLALTLFSQDATLQQAIRSQIRVGNLNFNHPRPRGSAGALPTGGVGPSGTGPQIGGPHYLLHFTCERTRVTLLR